MDARMRRTVGWVVAAVGLVIAIVGGLADQIGLGGDGENDFGSKQVLALVVGLVILAVGIGLAFLSKESADGGTPTATASSEPTA